MISHWGIQEEQVSDTLTKAAEAVDIMLEDKDVYEGIWDEDSDTESLCDSITKAAARVILDSPEVMGLVEALEFYEKHENYAGTYNQINADAGIRAGCALSEFQKLKESVG